MKTVKFTRFSCSLLETESDVVQLPLNKTLFGINNRIYANMFSVNMSKNDIEKYKEHFTEEELKFPVLNRLYQIHVSFRNFKDKYTTIDEIDFMPLFNKVKNEFDNYESIYARYHDSGKDYEKTILHLPLNSNVLRQGCNYAYNIIEHIKMENVMMEFNPKPVKNFLSIF